MNVDSCVVEVASGDETIATVVPGATDDQDRGVAAGREHVHRDFSDGAASVFHQDEHGHGVEAQGLAVDAAERLAVEESRRRDAVTHFGGEFCRELRIE
jgi:phage baseplate assembly protein gpV